MKRCALVVTVVFAALLATGCGQDPVRVENPDANGPIVNPLAPGARAGAHAPTSNREYTAPPGMKTGIPK